MIHYKSNRQLSLKGLHFPFEGKFNLENLWKKRFIKKYNIRFDGKSLGRLRKQTAENTEQIKREIQQRRQDALDRIPIEGKFGQGKNGYRLNYIQARTQKTSQAWINSIFLVMNLMVLLRKCCFFFISQLKTTV